MEDYHRSLIHNGIYWRKKQINKLKTSGHGTASNVILGNNCLKFNVCDVVSRVRRISLTNPQIQHRGGGEGLRFSNNFTYSNRIKLNVTIEKILETFYIDIKLRKKFSHVAVYIADHFKMASHSVCFFFLL